jgi:hypothetical protein
VAYWAFVIRRCSHLSAVDHGVFLPADIRHHQITGFPRGMFGLNDFSNPIACHDITTNKRTAIGGTLHPSSIRGVLRQQQSFNADLTYLKIRYRDFIGVKAIETQFARR